MEGCDVLGVLEIADLLDVRPRTPHLWKHRGLLPEPDCIVNGSGAWSRETILEWARQTGRLPEHLRTA